MKVGDTIAVPGYGEFMLYEGTNMCLGCAAAHDDELCASLPTIYCTRPKIPDGAFPNVIFLRVEK